MSGFFAPSPSMRLSKAQYLEQYGHLRRGGWARGKGLGASMVAHILDRPHGQLGRTNAQTNWEDVAPGDLSPWISATRSLDHAIWDISNRLARGETVVKMAVIRQSKGADAGGWEWSERGKTRSIRGSEVWTMATGEMAVERKEAPYGEKPHWDRAHRRVLACDVNLYYGRICGDSVAADLTFTREVCISPVVSPGSLSARDLRLTLARRCHSPCLRICCARPFILNTTIHDAAGSASSGGTRHTLTGLRQSDGSAVKSQAGRLSVLLITSWSKSTDPLMPCRSWD